MAPDRSPAIQYTVAEEPAATRKRKGRDARVLATVKVTTP